MDLVLFRAWSSRRACSSKVSSVVAGPGPADLVLFRAWSSPRAWSSKVSSVEAGPGPADLVLSLLGLVLLKGLVLGLLGLVLLLPTSIYSQPL